MDLLQQLTFGHPQWTRTVSQECEDKESQLNLPGMYQEAQNIFGEPLVPQDDEHVPIRSLRQQMASAGEHHDKHLGEAEAVTIIERRQLNAIFVTDDTQVPVMAEFPCITSWELLALGLKRQMTDRCTVTQMRSTLLQAGRVHVEEIKDVDRFNDWLQQHCSPKPRPR